MHPNLRTGAQRTRRPLLALLAPAALAPGQRARGAALDDDEIVGADELELDLDARWEHA